MKKVLLLLCILSITIGAKAQNPASQIGINQMSMNPVIIESSGFKDGWYYDAHGTKHSGLLEIMFIEKVFMATKPGYLSFKTEKKEKPTKISSADIKSVVLHGDSTILDSFVITSNEDLKNRPFVRVYFSRGNEAIYVSQKLHRVGIGITVIAPAYTYFYGTNPNEIIKLSGKRFKETMSKLLADKPWVVKKIKDGTFYPDNMDDLMYFYKNDKLPESMMPPIND